MISSKKRLKRSSGDRTSPAVGAGAPAPGGFVPALDLSALGASLPGHTTPAVRRPLAASIIAGLSPDSRFDVRRWRVLFALTRDDPAGLAKELEEDRVGCALWFTTELYGDKDYHSGRYYLAPVTVAAGLDAVRCLRWCVEKDIGMTWGSSARTRVDSGLLLEIVITYQAPNALAWILANREWKEPIAARLADAANRRQLLLLAMRGEERMRMHWKTLPADAVAWIDRTYGLPWNEILSADPSYPTDDDLFMSTGGGMALISRPFSFHLEHSLRNLRLLGHGPTEDTLRRYLEPLIAHMGHPKGAPMAVHLLSTFPKPDLPRLVAPLLAKILRHALHPPIIRLLASAGCFPSDPVPCFLRGTLSRLRSPPHPSELRCLDLLLRCAKRIPSSSSADAALGPLARAISSLPPSHPSLGHARAVARLIIYHRPLCTPAFSYEGMWNDAALVGEWKGRWARGMGGRGWPEEVGEEIMLLSWS